MRNLASPGAWSVHIQEEKVSHIPSLGEEQLPAPFKQKAYLGKFGTSYLKWALPVPPKPEPELQPYQLQNMVSIPI